MATAAQLGQPFLIVHSGSGRVCCKLVVAGRVCGVMLSVSSQTAGAARSGSTQWQLSQGAIVSATIHLVAGRVCDDVKVCTASS